MPRIFRGILYNNHSGITYKKKELPRKLLFFVCRMSNLLLLFFDYKFLGRINASAIVYIYR